MLNVCGNSVGVIPIESQSAAVYANDASSELSPDNQPRHEGGKVETAAPTFPITVNSPLGEFLIVWSPS